MRYERIRRLVEGSVRRLVSGKAGHYVSRFCDVFRKSTTCYFYTDTTELMRQVTGKEVSRSQLDDYLAELRDYAPLRKMVELHQVWVKKSWPDLMTGRPFAAILFLYIACRILHPKSVIETGCATGWTSSLILLALHNNRDGHLFSIDIPAVAGKYSMGWTLPASMAPGFIVPDELRSRWDLVIGDARAVLMPLIEKIQPLDLFYHNSNHTYQHMMWEYTSVWPVLSERGILVSDDISWNMAFYDFARALNRPIFIHTSNGNFGAIVRQPLKADQTDF